MIQAFKLTQRFGSLLTATAIVFFTLAPMSAHAQEGGTEKPMKGKDTVKAMSGETSMKAAEGKSPKKEGSMERTPKATDKPYGDVTFAKGEKPIVTMETSMGTMKLELWPDVALQHCQSMVHLIESHYYDSVAFHRIIDGFVVQGGDPTGTGSGGPGYTVPAEFNKTPHDFGILSMARTPDPNSAGSQFFLCLSREKTKSLDGQYTVFGKVVEGEDVLRNMGKVKTGPGDRPNEPIYMTKVTVERSKQP